MQRSIFQKIEAERKRGFRLRMAPLIDMIFLLLIFFLVAGKWRPEEAFLPFQLPAAGAQSQRVGVPEPLIIHVFAREGGCEVQIGGVSSVVIRDEAIEADLAKLMGELKGCMVTEKRLISDPMEIVCEGKVKWGYLAKIYNLFYGAGFIDITFAMTEQSENGYFD